MPPSLLWALMICVVSAAVAVKVRPRSQPLLHLFRSNTRRLNRPVQLIVQNAAPTSEENSAPAKDETTAVRFPSYFSLSKSPNTPSQSEPFKSCGQWWAIVIYPGGNKKKGRVGVYLKWLSSDPEATCDATFSLQLVGKQQGRRFNVEFSSGMRFVDPSRKALSIGLSPDFGSHLLETRLMQQFCGGGTFGDAVDICVSIKVWRTGRLVQSEGLLAAASRANRVFWQAPKDLRGSGGIRTGMVVVPVIAPGSAWPGGEPNLGRLLAEGSGGSRGFRGVRAAMFQAGSYPGVEYRVLRVFGPATSGIEGEPAEAFEAGPGSCLELKPLYPLVAALERPWPVRVSEEDVPALFSQGAYNTVAVGGAALTAAGGLALAALVSSYLSLYVIPSKSMSPTLEPGDVLLVEKVRGALARALPGKAGLLTPAPGEVVLFPPPDRLGALLRRSQASGGAPPRSTLFVKRVVARGGDRVAVDAVGEVAVNGQVVVGRDLCEAEPLNLIRRLIADPPEAPPGAPDYRTSVAVFPSEGGAPVPPGELFVMGDCSSVSVDSRVWGSLPQKNVVGRPLARIWPLSRVGVVRGP